MKKAKSVSAYIAAAPPAVRARLKRLRQVIKRAAPKATARISYGIPFYEPIPVRVARANGQEARAAA